MPHLRPHTAKYINSKKKKKAREREKDKKSVLGQMPQKGEPLFGIKVKGF